MAFNDPRDEKSIRREEKILATLESTASKIGKASQFVGGNLSGLGPQAVSQATFSGAPVLQGMANIAGGATKAAAGGALSGLGFLGKKIAFGRTGGSKEKFDTSNKGPATIGSVEKVTAAVKQEGNDTENAIKDSTEKNKAQEEEARREARREKGVAGAGAGVGAGGVQQEQKEGGGGLFGALAGLLDGGGLMALAGPALAAFAGVLGAGILTWAGAWLTANAPWEHALTGWLSGTRGIIKSFSTSLDDMAAAAGKGVNSWWKRMVTGPMELIDDAGKATSASIKAHRSASKLPVGMRGTIQQSSDEIAGEAAKRAGSLGKVAKVAKVLSKAAVPISVAVEGGMAIHDIVQENKKLEEGAISEEEFEKFAAEKATGAVGAVGGGLLGAAKGAALGSFLGPIGTVIGGVVGGVAGAWLGQKGGEAVGGAVYGEAEGRTEEQIVAYEGKMAEAAKQEAEKQAALAAEEAEWIAKQEAEFSQLISDKQVLMNLQQRRAGGDITPLSDEEWDVIKRNDEDSQVWKMIRLGNEVDTGVSTAKLMGHDVGKGWEDGASGMDPQFKATVFQPGEAGGPSPNLPMHLQGLSRKEAMERAQLEASEARGFGPAVPPGSPNAAGIVPESAAARTQESLEKAADAMSTAAVALAKSAGSQEAAAAASGSNKQTLAVGRPRPRIELYRADF